VEVKKGEHSKTENKAPTNAIGGGRQGLCKQSSRQHVHRIGGRNREIGLDRVEDFGNIGLKDANVNRKKGRIRTKQTRLVFVLAHKDTLKAKVRPFSARSTLILKLRVPKHRIEERLILYQLRVGSELA